MARRQFAYTLEDARGVWYVAESQILIHGGRVDLAREFLQRQQRPQLGGERDAIQRRPVVQRLDTQAISRYCKSTGAIIPDRKGEHPSQLLYQACTKFLIEVHEHLGVRA